MRAPEATPAPVPDDAPSTGKPASATHASGLNGLLWLVGAAFFMQTLDSTIVNTAVPSIAQALAVTPLSLRTALTSYVLALAIFIPASPWLADRFGTRRVFAASILIFSLGSLACGLAQNLQQLIAARVLQGMGGALLMPVGRYVLVRAFGKRDYVAAMSKVAIPGLLGPILGPLLGGALSQFASWRLIFLINLPVGLLGLWLNRRQMPDYHGARRPFDFIGFALFALTSVLLLTAAERASDGGDARVLAAIVGGGVVSAFLYGWHSRRVEHPVAKLALLRTRSFAIAAGGGLMVRLGLGGLSFLMVLFLQVGCGWSPLAAGLMLVPQALGMMLMKLWVDRVITRVGYRRVLSINTLVAGALLTCFALLTPRTPAALIGALMFVYGFVMSLQYTAMNTLAFVDLDASDAAQASALLSTAQYLAVSFGIALASLWMALFIGGNGHVARSYVSAFHLSILLMAATVLTATLVFRRLRRDRPPRRRVDTPQTGV